MSKTMVSNLDVQLKDMIEMSEPGNAERLRAIAMGTIHYVDTWNTWIIFRDGKWDVDGGGVGLQALAKQVPQSLFLLATGLKSEEDKDYKELHIAWGRKSNTEPQLKRMVTLARDLPGMRITSDELDAKPFLFNMQNGTFDFKAGEFRDHDPGDLLTKQANVMYDPAATCPVWERCMEQWQPDRDIQHFLQSIAGSGLIGEPVQNLFVNVGAGRNGKGTFYKQIQLILGDYAGTAPEDMLVESRFRVHEEEKARLRGCRFLVAPETSVGDRLDEAGIKNMTGGDMIHARHLYGRPFDFKPSHTAFLHTNYEPQIRGTDPAIWNRVVKIPWNTYIKEDQRDTMIDYKLEVERPGILNWLIAGCTTWLKHGLKKPPAIARETEAYRADQDTIGRFLDDKLETMVAEANSLGPVDYIPASILRKQYEEWCHGEGIKPWIATNVGRELRHKGWEPFVKRIGKTTANVWKYQNAITPNHETPGPALTVVDCCPVVPSSILSPLGVEEEKVNKEVNIEIAPTDPNATTQAPTEPSEQEAEDRHREWLYDHGYPVPPTDEEIEAYQRQQEQEYEHPYDTTPEPPEVGEDEE